MRVAFVTVGDTTRLTGGYLYNARLISGLRKWGVEVEEISASGASPEEQRAASERFGADFDPALFDAVVIDALACFVCAPHLDLWRKVRAVIALVHELPGVAAGFGSPDPAEETLLRADFLVTVSRHGKSILEERGVPGERIRVVPPGFDRLELEDDESARGGHKVRALCVAQWIPRKGILDLVEAWRSHARPNAELILVGETDADPDYAGRVRDAIGDDPSIIVAGPVDNPALREANSSADFFVLPSRFEGYGMVYAEAMGSGLPIIACDVGPVPELVGEGAAVLVPPEDAGAISGALDLLVADRDTRERMSTAAGERAGTLPGWKDTVREFQAALREAVSLEESRRKFQADSEFIELDRLPESSKFIREQNRRSWNAVVGAHESHRPGLARFLREGGSTLFPEDRRLLGSLEGKKLAHLLCNASGDSLSLANLGAKVTGVDISDEAIAAARGLSDKTSIPAEFVRADIYEWLEASARERRSFDIVYGSYGAVCWLPDLDVWAKGVAGILGSGGRFVLVDFHPVADMFDEGWNLVRGYPADGERKFLEEGIRDYVGESAGGLTPGGFTEGVEDFQNPEPVRLFRWGLGEVVTALAGAGLRILTLEEYPYSNGERPLDGMRELPGRRVVPPEGVPELPLMYGIRAEKR